MTSPRIEELPETVYTVPESSVYHLTSDCPALNRVDRYWPAQAERRQQVRGRPRRLCKLCSQALAQVEERDG